MCYPVDGCDVAWYVSKDETLYATAQVYYYPLSTTLNIELSQCSQ